MSTPWRLSKNRKERKNTRKYYKKKGKNFDLKGTWLMYDCCIALRNIKRSIHLLRLSGKTWYSKEGQNNKKHFASSIESLLGQIGFIVIYTFLYARFDRMAFGAKSLSL